MLTSYEELRDAALSLPEMDRLHLASDLLGSVPTGMVETEESSELSPDFQAELDRRLEDFTSGREPGIPWEDVQKEVDAILREP